MGVEDQWVKSGDWELGDHVIELCCFDFKLKRVKVCLKFDCRYVNTVIDDAHSKLYISRYVSIHVYDLPYSRKVWRGKDWQIDSFRAFGERKFGELKDQPIDY